MRFDWYQASCSEHVDEVLPVVLDSFGPLVSHRIAPAMHGFGSGVEVHASDQVHARIWWGGFMQHGCHVQATGGNAPCVAGALRDCFPSHRVSRADVCEDYSAEDAWDQLSGVCVGVARKHRVKITHAGDFEYLRDGRSLYFGSKTSVTTAVLYEKGKQLRSDGADPRWVRMEVRCRPKSLHKQSVAMATEPQIFGSSNWTHEIGKTLELPDVQRMRAGVEWRPSDELRANRWMLRQYGRLLSDQALKLGSWARLGEMLGEQLKQIAEEDEHVKSVARQRL